MIVVVDELKVNEPKDTYNGWSFGILWLVTQAPWFCPFYGKYEGVIRSTNNIPDAKVLNANYINIRDLMVFDKLVRPWQHLISSRLTWDR